MRVLIQSDCGPSIAVERVLLAAHERSDLVVDAVCPLVKKVERPEDVAALTDLDPDRPVAFLAQTTLGVGEWQEILRAAKARFGDVWLPAHGDLCFATTNRQAALQALAPRCDTVVVIGSANSSNTLALVRVAEGAARPATRVLRINGPDELPGDLQGTDGVTAGASAPEELVQQVLARLAPRAGTEEVDVTPEDEYFPPPRDLRELMRSLGADGVLDDDRRIAAGQVLDQLQLGVFSARVDRQMAEVIDAEVADPWLRRAIGYHLGWLDERFEPLDSPAARSGGKKLRATLAIRACRAAGGPVERALPFAAAVELIHNWSLVHDDIEDGDRTRRGRPALWTICGEAQAINVGDCIHALAFRSLARLAGVDRALVAELMAELAHTAVKLTVGQMRDLTFETTLEVDSREYLEMIEGKTAALLRCCTYGGALLAGGDHRAAGALGEFGRRLGLAFQIRDDILGIWGLDQETGKPTGSDLRRRKKTLPVVLAFEHSVGPDRERLRRIYAGLDPLSPAELADVLAALDNCEAGRQAQAQADEHRAAAVAALEQIGDGGVAHISSLRAIADFVTQRTY